MLIGMVHDDLAEATDGLGVILDNGVQMLRENTHFENATAFHKNDISSN
jgi:hypothetical protein